MSNAIQKLHDLGQSVWCDNLGRKMLDAGELKRWLDLGVTGVTSNPTILMKAVTSGTDYDALFDKLLTEDRDVLGLYEGLVLPDIADAADLMRPIYDRTDGADGFVSLEVNPWLAGDTEGTIAEARRLFTTLNRPNVMIKVPATEEGIPAIETLIAEGVNVNVTLIFALAMYEKVMQAYLAGLRKRDQAGQDLSKVASVASFFISRVDTAVDAQLEAMRDKNPAVSELLGQAAIANAKLAYARFGQVFSAEGAFADLAAKGARVQRPLWASTSTKNPAYSPTMYVDRIVAPNSVNTLPPVTIDALLELDTLSVTIYDKLDAARTLPGRLSEVGIDMAEVTDKLRVDGINAFVKSFEQLLADVSEKEKRVRTASS